MKHNNFPEIKTERLFLRRLKQSDWEIISYLRSDKDVNEFVKRPNAKSKVKALEFISKTNNGIDNRNLYYWTITKKDNDEMIGSYLPMAFFKRSKNSRSWVRFKPKFSKTGNYERVAKKRA